MVPSAATKPAPASIPKPATAVSAPLTKPRTNPPVAVAKPAAVQTAHTNLVKEPEPVRGWVDFERWTHTNGVGQVNVLTSGSQPKFELVAPVGRLDFVTGSQFAKWNGLNFMLGYAPQVVAHEISVNGMDIQKSVLPLIQPRPVNLRGHVIVIDPGHGGDQRGTKSVVGVNKYEKEFTLDWALRLQTLLASNGWKVYLTRTNDVDIPLHERVAVADRVQADLFLSLHFNAGSASGAESGVETYCMTPYGMPSNLTRGYTDDPYYNWPNNAYDQYNFTLAMRLHRAMVSGTGAVDRSVRRARFMAVLRTQRRPAVLIEGGYLSNRHEATLINTPGYRQKLAQAVANAFPAITKQ
jgi:N-acetylmuramoyl-L-alanine amidase